MAGFEASCWKPDAQLMGLKVIQNPRGKGRAGRVVS